MVVLQAGRDVAAERASIDAEIAGKTLLSVFQETVERLGEADALKWKEGAEWRALSWAGYREAVREVALGLVSIGFQPGQFALIMSRNRPEATIADLATQHARGTPVFLYNTLAPEQVAYIANHCEASVAFVEDRGFLQVFEAVRPQLKHLRRIVLLEPEAEGDSIITWAALRGAGRALGDREPDLFDATWRQVRPDDLAALVYTSGTTGTPKGAMISHRAILWVSASGGRIVRPKAGARTISYLPLAHVTGRWLDVWGQVINGPTVHFCPDPTQLFQYAVEVRPTQLVGVPRVWEKLYAGLQAGIAAEPDPARRQLVEQAIEVGRQLVRLRQAGQTPPAELLAATERAEPVWRAMRAKVGLDQCELAATGAAPIDPRIIEFFQAIGLPMTEGWGMTELTYATMVSPLDRVRNGTIGPAAPGVEARLAEDGELLVRCGSLMQGYYKDPEGTAAAIDADGWLHTGDLATVDDEGYFRIVGRKKELIITSGGKNIAPAAIEHRLEQHPLVGQACAIGDRRSYITALIVLDPDVAPLWARQHGIQAASLAELAAHPAVQAEIEQAVAAANAHLARVEQVKRFRVLASEWTAMSGELTPTLKKRRHVVAERYAREIDALYAD